jgi:protein involved in polysaccharide export with SLBB domain
VAPPAYVIGVSDVLKVEAPRALPNRPVSGDKPVHPDGSIHLGFYGPVRVAGLTPDQARAAITAQLAKHIKRPQVSVEVSAYNSKACYVVVRAAGAGDQVIRLPYTGSDTVLDALSQVDGRAEGSSHRRVWLARPGDSAKGAETILPIDYEAITRPGSTAGNYPLLPGDRVYIESAGPSMPFGRLWGFKSAGPAVVNPPAGVGGSATASLGAGSEF